MNIDTPPLAQFVLNTIREYIFKNQFKPGERLNEVKLATQFGTSRSPVREALQQLASEGLVKIVPRKGAYVVKIEYDEIPFLFEVREAVDGIAARLAAKRADRIHIQKLIDTIELTRTVLFRNSHPIYPLDFDFHQKIFEATKNNVLIEKGYEIHSQLRLARFQSGSGSQRAQVAFEEHCTILEAIKMRAPDEAEAAMRNHVKNALANVKMIIGKKAASHWQND